MHIPNSFVTTSGIDSLNSDGSFTYIRQIAAPTQYVPLLDISRIVQLVGNHCSQRCLVRLMRKQPNVPLIALDITNLHLVERSIRNEIPIIHISKDCKALQNSLARDTRKPFRPIRTIFWAGLAFYFGFEQTCNQLVKWFVVSASSMLLVREIMASRRDYSVKTIQGECFVIRDDAVRTPVRFFFLQAPLCCLAGMSALAVLTGLRLHTQSHRK